MPLEDTPNAFKGDNRYDLRTVEVPAPGAGNVLSWNVPAGLVVHVTCVTFRLATSLVAGERWPFVCTQTGVALTMNPCPVIDLLPPNTTRTYYLTTGIPAVDMVTVPACNMIVGPLGCCLEIKDGEQLGINCWNMDAADAIDQVRIRFREWREK